MNTWKTIGERANALREHWNKVKTPKGNPGDGLIGNMIGALLEAIDAHEKQDPFAVLHAAEEAVLIADGWTRAPADEDANDWWTHPTKGRETHDCALAMATYEHDAAKGGAS